MATINPFYRFESGWNAGFYPDNLIISNLLNDLYSELASWLPAYSIGLTIDELYAQITAIVNNYNTPPNYGDLLLQINYLTTSDFVIIIYNQSLIATDDTQAVIIVGFNDSITGLVISATLAPFTVGAYSGTFDAALINTEQDVARALLIADQNGSAFFPSTYTYNPTTGVATSGLARGKNWKLNSDNNPSRFPANTSQYQNARIFSFSEQPPDEKYIFSLIEKIIGASLIDSTYSSILALFNSITVPNGWDKTIEYSAVTSERIQINIYNSSKGYVYTLVGRLDGSWLWQRFFNRVGVWTPDGFLLTYDGSIAMPYEPLTPSSYLFLGWYYELDFCEFNSGCYESPEFYQMPAMPGDNLQFNINKEEANLEFLDSVKVGLFDENGMFLQQIGESITPPCCFEFLLAYQTVAGASPNFYAWFDLIEGINTYYSGIKFQFSNQTINYLGTTASSQITADLTDFILEIAAPLPFDRQDFIDLMAAQSWGYGITVTGELINNGAFEGVKIKFCNYKDAPFPSIVAYYYNPGSGENVFQSYINSLCCDKKQLQSSILIPSVNAGCYRFGLYEDAGVDGFYLYSISNIIRIDASDCFSTIIEYWSDNNSIAQGFEYFNNWRQRIRLGINGGGDKPIITESIYRQSNGVHRRPQNKQDLSVDLHTDFLDRETQLALVDATRHPYFVWNDRNIFVKGDIEVATIQDFSTQSSFETLAQVKFQALVQGFQPKNSSCITC